MILGNFFPGQRKAAQSTGIIYTPVTKQTHSRAQTRTFGTTPPSASSFHANSDPLSLEGRNAFSWKPGHGKDGSWLSQEGVLRKLLQTDGDPGGGTFDSPPTEPTYLPRCLRGRHGHTLCCSICAPGDRIRLRYTAPDMEEGQPDIHLSMLP